MCVYVQEHLYTRKEKRSRSSKGNHTQVIVCLEKVIYKVNDSGQYLQRSKEGISLPAKIGSIRNVRLFRIERDRQHFKDADNEGRMIRTKIIQVPESTLVQLEVVVCLSGV